MPLDIQFMILVNSDAFATIIIFYVSLSKLRCYDSSVIDYLLIMILLADWVYKILLISVATHRVELIL